MPSAPLPYLPAEVVMPIVAAAQLRGWELARLCCVSRTWRKAITGAGHIWREALRRDFEDGTGAQRAALDMLDGGYMPLRSVMSLLRHRELRSAANKLREINVWLRGTRQPRSSGDRARFMAEGWSETSLAERGCAAAAVTGVEVGGDARGWASVHVVETVAWRHYLGTHTSIIDGCRCCTGREYFFAPVALAKLRAANEELVDYWLNLAQPYELAWTAQAPAGGAALTTRPRRLKLDTALRDSAALDADYRIYTALATALLRGRCRACNRPTHDVHPTLGVPMCAVAACAGAYRREAQAGGAVKAAARRPRAWRPRRGAKRADKARRAVEAVPIAG